MTREFLQLISETYLYVDLNATCTNGGSIGEGALVMVMICVLSCSFRFGFTPRPIPARSGRLQESTVGNGRSKDHAGFTPFHQKET